jgi:hypothetical protein
MLRRAGRLRRADTDGARTGMEITYHVRRGLFRSFVTFAFAVASLRALDTAPALFGRAGATHFQWPGPPSILQPPWVLRL